MKKLFWKVLIFALAVCLSLVLVSCGENTPTVEISEDGYWVIDGEKTDVKAEGEKGEKGDKGDVGAQGSKGDSGTQGEDGKTPDFKIENGELKVSYDGGNTWTSLGTVKGEDGEDLTFTDDNPQGLDFFLKDDGTYSVGIGNAIYLSEITIPASYNGIPVTEIGDFCPVDVEVSIGSQFKKINIPDSVTTIGEEAFAECESLTSIVIPDSVTTIGGYAFDECESLTSVVIGDSVTTIGEGAFSGCESLTSIVIPDSVTSIGDYAFSWCTNLTSITVSENNTAYKDINGNLYTKDGKTLIQYAMGKTDTSFTIPDSVTTIGEWAFSGCESLTSIVIPDSVTTIGEGAFSGCESLTSVVIGDSVTTIGEEAFYSCDSLTSIVIPDSVTTIGEGAFSGCQSLTSIVIPDSVTTIGEWAFDACKSLTDVYYTGSELEWADIIIEGENYRLNEAIIHFNYIGE